MGCFDRVSLSTLNMSYVGGNRISNNDVSTVNNLSGNHWTESHLVLTLLTPDQAPFPPNRVIETGNVISGPEKLVILTTLDIVFEFSIHSSISSRCPWCFPECSLNAFALSQPHFPHPSMHGGLIYRITHITPSVITLWDPNPNPNPKHSVPSSTHPVSEIKYKLDVVRLVLYYSCDLRIVLLVTWVLHNIECKHMLLE